MKALSSLRKMGVRVVLDGTEGIRLAGLGKLDTEEAEVAVELARVHKAAIVEELIFDEAHSEPNDARTRPAWSELPTEPCPWCGRTLFWENCGRSWRCAWCAEPAEPGRWTLYKVPGAACAGR